MTGEGSALASPLGRRGEDLRRAGRATAGAVSLEEVAGCAQVSVRGDAAARRASPIPLPREPNTVAPAGARRALWMGPDEWLVVGAPGTAPAIVAELESAFEGARAAVVDVSANRAVVEVRGPGRHELLARGCSLDLHPRAWGPGRCAQSLLARVPVLLEERDGATLVYAGPSYGDHLVDWLLDAAEGLGG